MKELSEYDLQAEKFLTKTNSQLEIKRSHYQKKPIWYKEGQEFGYCYDVKLSNSKGEFIFNFWDSVANKEKELHQAFFRTIKPSAYDVLACLQGYEPESGYYEFCEVYGYEPSRMAEKTFQAVQNEWSELSKLYTPK